MFVRAGLTARWDSGVVFEGSDIVCFKGGSFSYLDQVWRTRPELERGNMHGRAVWRRRERERGPSDVCVCMYVCVNNRW